jgi:glyceraldehyde-3-phosphate dehydrogenase [NAD(P)+]
MEMPDLSVPLTGIFSDLAVHTGEGPPVTRLWIGGRWREASDGKTLEVRCPMDGSAVARAAQATVEDTLSAVEAARPGHTSIREMPAIQRVGLMEKAARLLEESEELVARTIQLEAGKPMRDARSEVRATGERLRMVLQDARKISGEYLPGDWAQDTVGKIALVIHEPVGVVAAISSFNYPLYIAAAKVIPALLAGNSVVAKPASETPLALLLFARILQEAGLPDGSLNVITGRGGSIGDALVSHQAVGLVTFTGSTEVGKHIASVAGLKPLHLELGGKGLAIVLDDADLRHAAAKCVEGSLRNAGQRCDAVSAILVVEPVADKFVELAAGQMKNWPCGDPRDEKTRVGPVINESAAERIHSLVKDAADRGAEVLAGGTFKACFYEPTLLDHVPKEAAIATEETFGPVVTVIRVKDEDEALEMAGRPRYGLDSCVFTSSFYRMWRVAKRLEVGEVTINDLPRHGIGYFPFGGTKESGIGREGIGYSIEEMTHLKTIVFNLQPAGLGKELRE